MFPDSPTELSWQGSLFAAGAPGVDGEFSRLERRWLDDCCWVDMADRWLSGADDLFSALVPSIPWGQRRVTMYGNRLDEPRLTAWWPLEGPEDLPHPALVEAWSALCDHYDRRFDSLGANLYRDGHDSVAWHGDRIRHHTDEAVVAIISLGEARPFLLRRRGGGGARSLLPGGGDLLVMGGCCQHHWEHTVPKVAEAGPRLSLMFRHGADEPTDAAPRAHARDGGRAEPSRSASNRHPFGG